jgi:hypothetical protein
MFFGHPCWFGRAIGEWRALVEASGEAQESGSSPSRQEARA